MFGMMMKITDTDQPAEQKIAKTMAKKFMMNAAIGSLIDTDNE